MNRMRRRWATILAVLLIAAGAGAYGYYRVSQGPAPALAGGGCDPGLWNHVYHPNRLQGNRTCFAVPGVVDRVKPEADGDDHIRLHVDLGFDWMINDQNVQAQAGDLIVEAICVGAVTQSDAIAACEGYSNHVGIPQAGDRVIVTGTFVFDADHGWNELHPVSSIREA